MQEREQLDLGDAEPEQDTRQGEPEAPPALSGRQSLGLTNREIEREESRGDERVLRHLVMGAEQREADGEAEQGMSFELPAADAEHQADQHHREEGGHEQLAVVAWADIRDHHAAQLIGGGADH